MEDVVIATCPVCGRCLALGDRNGRHVASEAHYPRRDASGAMTCSPPGRAERRHLTVDMGGEPRSPGRAPLQLVRPSVRKVALR
jgi:hypothetical protein